MSVPGITQTSQYLTFVLDKEIYAININQVREVLDFTKTTRVPRMPPFIKGVINLRGGVVPVVDLRLKFGMAAEEQTVDTCIIIIEVSIEDSQTLLGIMADSVQEVMSMEPDQIEPAPKIGTRLKTEFIKGLGKRNDDFIIILDSDKVFSAEELTIVQEVEDTTEPEQE
ncbi:MAG: chemotaxis protein CheW [Proteobacteria bacterium]|nr:chemotaxis protein CheW [Pseudomonadota bacterium]